ncbi:MAG: ABC transporter permease, partial [Chitinophagaceae bacterium]|nr:ABC transporter permease [Chitinophagaceae bacterium]
LIACINFINLSTARNAASIKEAGLKKIIGASRKALILQYLADAILMAVLAMIIGVGITWLLLPQLSFITGSKIEFPSGGGYLLAAFAIALITGMIAGIYPAIYLSSFKPAAVLSGSIKRSATESGIRKGLMVFQFALSVFFIIAVSVVWQQLTLIQTRDLGYRREQLIYFDMAELPVPKDTGDLKSASENFLLQLKELPGVIDAASFGHNITNRDGGTTDLQWPGKDPEEKITFTDIAVGYHFIETTGIRMQEGRSYDESYGTDQGGIVFNQAAIKAMNMKDPIGKKVQLWGRERTIIGVVKDFNFQSLHEKLKPCFLDLVTGGRASKIMVRIDKQNTAGTIAAIDALFRKEQNGLAFDYTFLNDDYEAMYATENSMMALAKYFTFLAILISCLGLLGYTAFMARQKQKEIGIRKVAGASVLQILTLMAMEFLRPVLLGLLIAFPLGYWLMNNWLAGFAYRVSIGPVVFIMAGLAILLIMLASIGGQLMRAAMVSPAKSLKQ